MRHSHLLGKGTQQGNDQEELQEQRKVDAKDDELTRHDVTWYNLVTSSMLEALDPLNRAQMPEFSEKLPPSIRAALEALYMAYTAKGMENGELYLSGLERNVLLNQALRQLQPVLALALRPDFLQGRDVYFTLVDKVTTLRNTIIRAILAQAGGRMRRAAQKKKEQDDDDPVPVVPPNADAQDSTSAAPEQPDAAPGAMEPQAGDADLAGDGNNNAEKPAPNTADSKASE